MSPKFVIKGWLGAAILFSGITYNGITNYKGFKESLFDLQGDIRAAVEYMQDEFTKEFFENSPIENAYAPNDPEKIEQELILYIREGDDYEIVRKSKRI